MSGIEEAISIAAYAHRGQTDKAGAPYILHPLRVMLSLNSEQEMVVGVLHDLVEDTDWTLERLRDRGFDDSVLAAIDSLTKRDSESYEEFIARVKSNPLARRVKLADLQDNADLARLPQPSERDLARREKYLRAIASLTEE